MSNVVDLSVIRANKADEARKADLRALFETLDRDVLRTGPEDKFFELRLRDALFDLLRAQNRLDPAHISTKSSSISFLITVEDTVALNTEDFNDFVGLVADNLPDQIGYLHSTMIAKQERDWSIMVRYYS
jgi:hypothetical protein